jgi:hypothetical protein
MTSLQEFFSDIGGEEYCTFEEVNKELLSAAKKAYDNFEEVTVGLDLDYIESLFTLQGFLIDINKEYTYTFTIDRNHVWNVMQFDDGSDDIEEFLSLVQRVYESFAMDIDEHCSFLVDGHHDSYMPTAKQQMIGELLDDIEPGMWGVSRNELCTLLDETPTEECVIVRRDVEELGEYSDVEFMEILDSIE